MDTRANLRVSELTCKFAIGNSGAGNLDAHIVLHRTLAKAMDGELQPRVHAVQITRRFAIERPAGDEVDALWN